MPKLKFDTVVAYNVPALDMGAPIKGSGRYLKEVIYEGDFCKDLCDGTTPLEFSITEDHLRHFQRSIRSQVKNGVRVDLPKTHTSDPAASRGKIIDAKLGYDSQGRRALFAVAEFKDKKAAKHFTATSDVSIFTVPRFRDGKGNEYVGAVRHVALTTEPVIPGLDGWESIAASYGEAKPAAEPEQVRPHDLAKRLSVPYDEHDADDAVHDRIANHVEDLQRKAGPMPSNPGEWEDEDLDDEDEDDLDDDDDVDDDDEDIDDGDGDDYEKGPSDMGTQDAQGQLGNGPRRVRQRRPTGRPAPSAGPTQEVPGGIQASFKSTLKSNREMKLNELVRKGCITRAVRDDLVKDFCSDQSLQLSLSHAAVEDGFNSLCATLTKNVAVRYGSQSPDQREDADLQLSMEQRTSAKTNPLIADAERRAADAAAKRKVG